MVLDMEGEFYKLAKKILDKPNTFYKVLSLGPESGRLTMMGADGGMIVGPTLVEYFVKGPGDRAFKYGSSVSKDIYGVLIEEFDEEVKKLGPKKLMELGLQLIKSTGWGFFEVKKMSKLRGKIVLEGRRTVELNAVNPPHHMFSLGLMSGIIDLATGWKMEGNVEEVKPESVKFSFKSL